MKPRTAAIIVHLLLINIISFAGDAHGRLTVYQICQDGVLNPLSPEMWTMFRFGDNFQVNPNQGTLGLSIPVYHYSEDRAIQEVTLYPDGNLLRTSLSHDIQGRPVQIINQHIDSSAETGASVSLTDSYFYDARGRMTGRTSQIIADNQTGNSNLSLGYDALGRLSQTVYGPSISPVATQTVSYTMQGWEEGRSIVDDSNNTVFSSVLHYDKPLSAYGYNNVVNTISWTGKVSSWEWQHGGRSLNAWALVYDNGGRLSDTRHYTSKILDNLNAESFVYDRNSNITSYTAKNGLNSSSVENYSFLGNRRGDFSYDANGNLTCMHEWMDPDSGEDSSSSLSYNLLNLPDNVTTYEDNYMDFRFLADGTKVSAIGYEDMGYKYAGPFRYLVNEGDLYLESCDAAGGRFWCIDRDTDPDNILLTTENSYFVIDHLGGIRAIIDGTGNLFEQSDYKPYGQRLRLSGVNSRNNAYLWTGKEQQTSFFGIPWFDSGARFLFTNGIFTSQDPLAEKYPGFSPYTYCKGDPINKIDPYGTDDKDKLAGAIIGSITNVIPRIGFVRDWYNPTDPNDYNNALRKADAVSLAVGGSMILGGGLMAATGASISSAGALATATVVGSPEGAIALAGGAIALTAGDVALSTGSMLMANSADNTKEGYNRGRAQQSESDSIYGETKSTKLGKEKHKQYNPGEGYKLNTALPSGKRPDAYSVEKGIVRELKPDNPRAVRRGWKQIDEYRKELEKLYPDISWTMYIDTY